MMNDDEEHQLRDAIRRALALGDYEQDIGFLTESDLPAEKAHELGLFAVLELPCGAIAVTIPSGWEHVPYIKEVLHNIALQELRSYLGGPQSN